MTTDTTTESAHTQSESGISYFLSGMGSLFTILLGLSVPMWYCWHLTLLPVRQEQLWYGGYTAQISWVQTFVLTVLIYAAMIGSELINERRLITKDGEGNYHIGTYLKSLKGLGVYVPTVVLVLAGFVGLILKNPSAVMMNLEATYTTATRVAFMESLVVFVGASGIISFMIIAVIIKGVETLCYFFCRGVDRLHIRL